MSEFDYSVVIPTLKRPDMITEFLQSLVALDYPKDRLEVIVVDNGGPEHSTDAAARPFAHAFCFNYLANDRNRGYGYSAVRYLNHAVTVRGEPGRS